MFHVGLMFCLTGIWQAEGFKNNYLPNVNNTYCPITFTNLADICYYFSTGGKTAMKTWQDAQNFCMDMGSDPGYTVGLAELNFEKTWKSDGEMLQKIVELKKNVAATDVPRGDDVWLGGEYSDTDSCWKWVNSNRMLSGKDSAWLPSVSTSGNPVNGNCLVGQVQNGRTYLVDRPCNTPLHFVCQLF